MHLLDTFADHSNIVSILILDHLCKFIIEGELNRLKTKINELLGKQTTLYHF